jgi:hypothetical protein
MEAQYVATEALIDENRRIVVYLENDSSSDTSKDGCDGDGELGAGLFSISGIALCDTIQ